MFFPVLLVIPSGLILQGFELDLLKFRGLSWCSHTVFLTAYGHLETVHFALPLYPH